MLFRQVRIHIQTFKTHLFIYWKRHKVRRQLVGSVLFFYYVVPGMKIRLWDLEASTFPVKPSYQPSHLSLSVPSHFRQPYVSPEFTHDRAPDLGYIPI